MWIFSQSERMPVPLAIIDITLDAYPQELWSDIASALVLMDAIKQFNSRARNLFSDPDSETVAADMFDCFNSIVF